jgi:menaquinone-dependent protoporphyrinogen oxidase
MKALIAYGTKYGSTTEVAEAIADELAAKGYGAEVRDLRRDGCDGVSGYDLVVLGSSVNIGKWTKEAQAFIDKNSAGLAVTRVALFACCSDILFPEKVEVARKAYLNDVAASIPGCEVAAKGLFGGVIDFARYSSLTRFLIAGVGMKKSLESKGFDPAKPYDYRDWDEIRAWARSL